MELWDIYDADKKITGRTMVRNDWNMKPGDYHLTVLAIVCNKEGNYLITRRSKTKGYAPGAWEISGGAVQAGEKSEDAIKREIKEETGVDVSSFEGGYVGSYRRDNPEEKDNYFVDIYKFYGDIDEKDIRLQEKETDGYMFATLEEINKFGEADNFLHYNSIKEYL
ncbi:MAG: NUDIX domain-containing protein [Lachnospiraceae bacterium]|nr:NUDIX domain-containing protein [Lachnospiraceae bacterium]